MLLCVFFVARSEKLEEQIACMIRNVSINIMDTSIYYILRENIAILYVIAAEWFYPLLMTSIRLHGVAQIRNNKHSIYSDLNCLHDSIFLHVT